MSKVLLAGMETHLGLGTTTLAACWKLTRKFDNQVFYFTNHDRDIPFGGDTYDASTGYTASAIANDIKMSVDNLEVRGLLDSDVLDEEELEKGLFDYSTIETFLVNWQFRS